MKAGVLALGALTLASPASRLSFAPDLPARLARLPRTPIDYDRALLDERETRALQELIEASRPVEEIFLRQVSTANPPLLRQLSSEATKGVWERPTPWPSSGSMPAPGTASTRTPRSSGPRPSLSGLRSTPPT